MKDIVRRIISVALPLGGLGMIARYMMHNVMIVQDAWAGQQLLVLGACVVILLAFFLQFGIVMFPGKWLKMRAVGMGLLLILVSHYGLADNVHAGVYAGDIMSVIALLMIFGALAGRIVTQKVEKKIKEGKQIIIEV